VGIVRVSRIVTCRSRCRDQRQSCFEILKLLPARREAVRAMEGIVHSTVDVDGDGVVMVMVTTSRETRAVTMLLVG
jgi:hypothetical protein